MKLFTFLERDNQNNVEVSLWTSHTEAAVGDDVDIRCGPKDIGPHSAQYVIQVNDERIYSRHVRSGVEATVNMQQDHFQIVSENVSKLIFQYITLIYHFSTFSFN